MENIKVKVVNIKDIESIKDYVTKEEIKDNIIKSNGYECVEFKILRKLLNEKLNLLVKEINNTKSRIINNIPIGYGISVQHGLEKRLNEQEKEFNKIKDIIYYLEKKYIFITIQADREKNIIRGEEEFNLDLKYVSGCIDTEEEFEKWIEIELKESLNSFKRKFSKYNLDIKLNNICLNECHYDNDEQIGEISADIICNNWIIEDNNIDVEENFNLDEELFNHLDENGFYEL